MSSTANLKTIRLTVTAKNSLPRLVFSELHILLIPKFICVLSKQVLAGCRKQRSSQPQPALHSSAATCGFACSLTDADVPIPQCFEMKVQEPVDFVKLYLHSCM